MKKIILLFILLLTFNISFSQNFGIVRANYFSSYYDSTLMMNIDVLDSGTIRLGSVNPLTGVVTNIGNSEYNSGINLNGATIDPYSNRYYIGSGLNLLTFDLNSGNIINNAPVFGSLPSASFQNFRFNTSDSLIYGMVPNNFYSTYYDSIAMINIDVLDSTQIRFASINPVTGEYSIIGNTSFNNLYTLAGNSIDPHQMLYYYSAVDTLIGIDLYTGAEYSAVPIQIPSNAIFENIAYSCSDTTIYGLTRQTYISSYYDSLLMFYIDVIDSTTFKLSKINPNIGVVTFVSPNNIGTGGNLTAGAFIDPNTMTYFFSNGNQIVGVSLITGLITSTVLKSYSNNAIAFDMMRSTQNCLGATKIRFNTTTGINETSNLKPAGILFPNPAQSEITLKINATISNIEILDFRSCVVLTSDEKTIDISGLPSGIYIAKITANNGELITSKFVKN
jgi:hypothetical protein